MSVEVLEDGTLVENVVDERDDLPIFIHSELDDLPLSVNAFRVYAHLVRRVGRNGKAWPSYKSIGEHCFRATIPDAQLSTLRRRAMEAVEELKRVGLISVEKRKDKDKGNTSNVYRLKPRAEWGVLDD